MARLINNKGTWQLQINKDQPRELYNLVSNLNGFMLQVEKEESQTHIFGIMDSCQGDTYHASESEYRNILSKISEFPEPDLVIPCDPPRKRTPEGQKWYDEVSKPMNITNLKFLEEVGQYPKNTKFQWTEENKPEKL